MCQIKNKYQSILFNIIIDIYILYFYEEGGIKTHFFLTNLVGRGNTKTGTDKHIYGNKKLQYFIKKINVFVH